MKTPDAAKCPACGSTELDVCIETTVWARWHPDALGGPRWLENHVNQPYDPQSPRVIAFECGKCGYKSR